MILVYSGKSSSTIPTLNSSVTVIIFKNLHSTSNLVFIHIGGNIPGCGYDFC
ncbi:MAG: hypothetical protein ACOX08_06475 [Methanobacterium sp.]|uniref:hypothetical protein n=1 Tax=Methanobacterium sp. MZD130B TaxID=3394378 RepID=UPI0039FC5C13